MGECTAQRREGGNTMFTPRVSSLVNCPEDRGEPKFVGKVLDVSDRIHENHQGHQYRWVEVLHPNGRKSLWASNRLSAA